MTVAGSHWSVWHSGRGTLHVQAGPGASDQSALVAWLARGCEDAVPIRQGFIAVLVTADGAVTVASSSRSERTALYAVDDGRLVLATNPRDLAAARGVRPALSVAKLAGLVALYDDPVTTVFVGVDRLPLGCVLRWRPSRPTPEVRQWFRPDTSPDAGIDPQQAPALMRTAIREAVAASLPASGDLAATLSGGLDSAMVVATAADLLAGSGRLLHTCTHVPLPGTRASGGWEADDGPYAERMAAEVADLTWTPLVNRERVSPFEVGRESFRSNWLPVLNPANNVWVQAAREFAASSGSPLLLTGASGNGPYSRGGAVPLRSLGASRQYRALARHLRNSRRTGASWAQATRPVLASLAPRVGPAVRQLARRSGSPDSGFSDLLPIRPELLPDGARTLLAALDGGGKGGRQAWVDLVLEDRSLRGVGSSPVWWSDPLSDPEVVSLALRLPEEAWLAGGRSRGLAREAARGLVPDHIRLRQTRGGQSHDLGIWLEGRERHLAEVYEEVAASPAASQFLDLPKLRASVTAFDPATSDVVSWDATTGRALGFGLFAAWYESEVLRGSR